MFHTHNIMNTIVRFDSTHVNFLFFRIVQTHSNHHQRQEWLSNTSKSKVKKVEITVSMAIMMNDYNIQMNAEENIMSHARQ